MHHITATIGSCTVHQVPSGFIVRLLIVTLIHTLGTLRSAVFGARIYSAVFHHGAVVYLRSRSDPLLVDTISRHVMVLHTIAQHVARRTSSETQTHFLAHFGHLPCPCTRHSWTFGSVDR